MTYQILVSTMEQNDMSLVDRMKLDSDAIIINQHNRVSYSEMEYNDNFIRMFTFAERGVGLSRNSAMMRATADIIHFADDDMVMVNGYQDLIMQEFEKHPDADAIFFGFEKSLSNRPDHVVKKFHRIGFFEGRCFPTGRIVVRRNALLYNNIAFSLLFGGGAKYGAGEDTMLIHDMIKAGLHVYASPIVVAGRIDRASCWFTGYNEKFYKDKGALLAAIFPVVAKPLALMLSVAHAKLCFKRISWYYNNYKSGIVDYRMIQRNKEC